MSVLLLVYGFCSYSCILPVHTDLRYYWVSPYVTSVRDNTLIGCEALSYWGTVV
jgi:hypothetical protein